jgi:hypothetical protein
MFLVAFAVLLLLVAGLLAIIHLRAPRPPAYTAQVRLDMAVGSLVMAERSAVLELHRALIHAVLDEARARTPLRSSLALDGWIAGLRMALGVARGTAAAPHVESALAIADEIRAAGVVPRGIG